MLTIGIVEKALYALAGFVIGLLAGRLTNAAPVGGATNGTAKRVQKGDGVEMYVGNLAYSVSRRDLVNVFSDAGHVVDVRIIRNKSNGKSKGYAFVELADQKAADTAVRKLNGKDVKGRTIVVKEARSRARDTD